MKKLLTLLAIVFGAVTLHAGEYPDIDMAFKMGANPEYMRKDGTPYTDIRRRGPDDN